jgi:hypothetical protein
MRKAEEFKLQAECVTWLWNTHPETRGCFFVIDNNASNTVEALQKRAMGLVKGVSDTCFIWHHRTYFIEFKSPTGILSPFQKKFALVCHVHSCGLFLINQKQQFVNFIETILNEVDSES